MFSAVDHKAVVIEQYREKINKNVSNKGYLAYISALSKNIFKYCGHPVNSESSDQVF